MALGVDGALLDAQVGARGRGVGRGGAGAACRAAGRAAAALRMRAGLAHAGQPVEGRRLRALDQAVERLHRLQLRHHLVQQTLRPRACQVQRHPLRIGQQLVGRHSGHDDEVANDDFEVVGPTRTQRCPHLLSLLRVDVGKLGGDVEEVVEHHLGGLCRAPALSAAARPAHLGRVVLEVGERVGRRHVWVDELHVVEPGQQVLQQQLPHLGPRRLEPVRDL